jgi:site-specific DNA-methyltransferase (adenine-specific)
MTVHYTDDRVTLYHGDCIEVMRTLPDASVDAVVTDPPYLLDFMGKGWDSADGIAGKPEVWREALRVLKPGGHLLAFGGTRTWHRLAAAIEDAGFEIRDSIAWMYGSGFPKSLDVSKAIDKRAGAEREVVGLHPAPAKPAKATFNASFGDATITAPATPAAEQWQGWGTALKPAHEPIVVARKPLIGTVAENVLTHGTGALNIDGCRIAGALEGDPNRFANTDGGDFVLRLNEAPVVRTEGRWPANVILDESQAAELDAQSGVQKDGVAVRRNLEPDAIKNNKIYGEYKNGSTVDQGFGGQGGASRFFYVAKASKKERPNVNGVAHPTVKPMALMQYLVRLVTPPGGTVLEPFAGSGTTIEAALNEGFNVIGIEMTDEYLPLIMSRIERYGDKLC